MNRIQKIFQNRTEKIIPFLTAGYPAKGDALNMVLAAEKSGAAMVELGMPFSDPLADGPVIQESSRKAIENGVTINWILETVSDIRKQSEIPIALMGYINPILKFGLTKFMESCSDAGVDGLIIPDLPPEEAADFVEMSKENNISPILLVAPNTPDSRIQEISKSARDLIYCVAILGITGSKGAVYEQLKSYLKRVDKNSSCPYIVGFGIKERSDVININKMAHGAVVGSEIIREIENTSDPIESVNNYIGRLDVEGILKKITENDQWSHMPTEMQKSVFRRVMRLIRNQAWKNLMTEDPELRAEMIQARYEQLSKRIPIVRSNKQE